MNFSRKSFSDFLSNDSISYQNLSMFEFRYPILFEDHSFLIDQLNFPGLDTHIGNIVYNGMSIPVHGVPKFESNELTFTMYAEDGFLEHGSYIDLYYSIMRKSANHNINNLYLSNKNKTIPIAYIIPLKTKTYDANMKKVKVISLYNALIKSVSMPGGFMSNSTTFAKFQITLTYSYFNITKKQGSV